MYYAGDGVEDTEVAGFHFLESCSFETGNFFFLKLYIFYIYYFTGT